MIALTHLNFKKVVIAEGIKTKYPSFLYPITNYIVLGFIAVVLYIMWMQGFKESVIMIPIWIVLMFVLYKMLAAKKS